MSNPKNDKIVIKLESNIACGLVKIPILEHPLGKKGKSYLSVLDYSMLVQVSLYSQLPEDAITAIASHVVD